MNCRRNEKRGGYPCAVPYWSAVVRSILRIGSRIAEVWGTTTCADVVGDSDMDVFDRLSETVSRPFGLFGVGLKRSGTATEASRVS